MEREKDRQFHSMYKKYYRVLCAITNMEGVPLDEVDDIVQEAFYSYYRYYRSLDLAEEERKPLLVRIVKNKCYDYFRRCKRRPSEAMDVEAYFKENESINCSVEKSVLDVVIDNEYYRHIRECMETLKPAQQEILMLMAVQERPAEEVSRMLGISMPACYTRLHRARKELESRLKRQREPATH